jgi:CrcB protein
VHLTPASVLAVAVGGAAGSLSRHGTEELVGTSDGLPVETLAVNLVGAFALGVLLEWLALRDPAGRRDEATRLLLGTGFLGGFTTYSALALQTDGLLRDGRVGLALAYALGTIVIGLLASVAGILTARAASR